MIINGSDAEPQFTTQNLLFSKAIRAVKLALFPFAITAVHGVRQDKMRGTRRG